MLLHVKSFIDFGSPFLSLFYFRPDGDSGVGSSEGPSRSVQAYATMPRMPRIRSSTSPNIHSYSKSVASIDNACVAPLATDVEDVSIDVATSLSPAQDPNQLFVDLPPERTSTRLSCTNPPSPLRTTQTPERSTSTASAVVSPSNSTPSNKTPSNSRPAVTASHWTTLPAQSLTPNVSRWDRSKLEATILPSKPTLTFNKEFRGSKKDLAVKTETTFDGATASGNKVPSSFDKTKISSPGRTKKRDAQQPPKWDYKQTYVVESYV